MKKKASTSPLQRSMKWLRSLGFLVEKVEHWNAFAKVRHDLFGIADLLCLSRDTTLAVQVTTLSHVGEHYKKLKEHPNLVILYRAGWEVEIHGWRKLKEGWKLQVTNIYPKGLEHKESRNDTYIQ